MAPPPKNQAEIDASNQYASYQRGWRTAARGAAIDPIFTTHDNVLIANAYSDGYTDGRHAAGHAMRVAAGKYGIDLATAALR